MIRIVFPSPALENLQQRLLERTDVETCAIGFTRAVGSRLLIADIQFPPLDAYAERTIVSATLTPEFVLEVANRARRENLGIVFMHSHPGDAAQPKFSWIDDAGESRLAQFLDSRAPGSSHVAMVVSPGGFQARILGSSEPVEVLAVGSKAIRSAVAGTSKTPDDRFDRQIRAFGQEGQHTIGTLTVAVVGAGGTGSITIQQLAHLGVSRFILIDYDRVEVTNLNRVVGARSEDVGALKIDVAERNIKQLNPSADVTLVPGDVAEDHAARQLLSADVIFLCTDSHASRAIVGQLAYQYLIPTIDMGVSISVRGGQLAYITGRVQLLSPGLPCLSCMDLLDPETIRRELLTPEARAADPYIVGFHEPQPSVVSLNGTMASLAITMFLGLVTSAPANARMQIYDGINGTVRNADAQRDEKCFVCSPDGALARGDSWPLPTRKI